MEMKENSGAGTMGKGIVDLTQMMSFEYLDDKGKRVDI